MFNFPISVSIKEISPVKPSKEEMKTPIFITYGNRKVETLALIDCGTKGASYIARSYAEKQQIPLLCLKKEIPVLNIDGTKNQDGAIQNYVDVRVEVQGRDRRLFLLVMSLG
jgi:hypothetical protein